VGLGFRPSLKPLGLKRIIRQKATASASLISNKPPPPLVSVGGVGWRERKEGRGLRARDGEEEDSSQKEFSRIRGAFSPARSHLFAISQVKLMPAGPLRNVEEGDVLNAIVLMQ
jgi:hypothetical protein